MKPGYPRKKLKKVSQQSVFFSKRKVSLKELQSLIGLLNFACSVVVPGRVFLRRLINLTIGIRKPHYFIRLTCEVRKDLKIWKIFLDSFNGKSFFLEDGWASSNQLCFFTDAAKSSGYALFLVNSWHMVNGQTHGKITALVFLSFFQSSLDLVFGGKSYKISK